MYATREGMAIGQDLQLLFLFAQIAFRAPLFRDVVADHIKAARCPASSQSGIYTATIVRMPLFTVASVFRGGRLSGERLFNERFGPAVSCSQSLRRDEANHFFFADTQPLFIGRVAKTISLIHVHVTDQGGEGIRHHLKARRAFDLFHGKDADSDALASGE